MWNFRWVCDEQSFATLAVAAEGLGGTPRHKVFMKFEVSRRVCFGLLLE